MTAKRTLDATDDENNERQEKLLKAAECVLTCDSLKLSKPDVELVLTHKDDAAQPLAKASPKQSCADVVVPTADGNAEMVSTADDIVMTGPTQTAATPCTGDTLADAPAEKLDQLQSETSPGGLAAAQSADDALVEKQVTMKKKDPPDLSPGGRLCTAAAVGDLQTCQTLIAEDLANVTYEDAKSWMPLQHAAWNGHAEIVRIIAEAKAPVDYLDSIDMTALHWAVWFNKKESTLALLELKANPDIPVAADGCTALHQAVVQWFPDIVQMLIAAGADLNISNRAGYTALSDATCQGYYNFVRYLLAARAQVAPSGPGVSDALAMARLWQRTELLEPFELASLTRKPNGAANGQAEEPRATEVQEQQAVEEALVQPNHTSEERAGTTTEIQDAVVDQTAQPSSPTHEAEAAGRMEDALVDPSAQPSSPALGADAATSTAAAELVVFDPEICEMAAVQAEAAGLQDLAMHVRLFAHRCGKKSAYHYKDPNGLTLLHHAVLNNNCKAIKLLMDAGLGIEWRDDKNATSPLYVAAMNGRIDALRLLMDLRAEKNALAFNKYTPLHQASFYGWDEAVKMLLEARIDANHQDDYGATPIYYASSKGRPGVVARLLAAGGVTDKKSAKGWTPLAAAVYRGQDQPVSLLIESRAELDTRDKEALGLLHHAAGQGHASILRTLMDMKVELNTRDSKERSPLDMALENPPNLHVPLRERRKDAIEILRAAGAISTRPLVDIKAAPSTVESTRSAADKEAKSMDSDNTEAALRTGGGILPILGNAEGKPLDTLGGDEGVNSSSASATRKPSEDSNDASASATKALPSSTASAEMQASDDCPKDKPLNTTRSDAEVAPC